MHFEAFISNVSSNISGYGYTTKAPAISSPGVGDYLCMHHVLLANAAVYHLYKEKYFDKQKGQVGICLNSGFSYPAEGVDPSLADKAVEFELGKFSNAIFSKEGGYPQVMIDEIGRKSAAEGRPWSRLPTFTEEQRKYVRGSADFLALNYYSSRLTKPRPQFPELPISWFADTDLDSPIDPSWKRAKSEWLYSVPEGLRDLLKWIKNRYDNPTVMITENGWSDEGEIEDNDRVDYLKAHLSAMSKAIKDDGCNVVAYTVWSLLDNFEWKMGCSERFGIHYIDFNSPDKTRVPKKSASFFKEFMKSKSFEYSEAKSNKKIMNPRMAHY
jgi:beta-glucosidase/6-phospho-beta-glucosidase/beta-galactosidase